MFEAPGVWSAQYDHTQADRVNRGRLAGFRDYVAKRRQPGSLPALLTTRRRVSQRPGRRVRRGLGAVVLPVRNAAAAVCRVS